MEKEQFERCIRWEELLGLADKGLPIIFKKVVSSWWWYQESHSNGEGAKVGRDVNITRVPSERSMLKRKTARGKWPVEVTT